MHPEARNATYGDNVKIICTTEPPHRFGVDWEFMRNGSNVPKKLCSAESTIKYECKNEINKHTLLVKNVDYNDSGTYTCIEKEGYGPGRNSSELTVYRK